MRSYLTIAMVLCAWAFAASGIAATREQTTTAVCTLKVTGMTCGGCEGAVKVAARKVPGVTAVTASYKIGTAEVTYDPAKTSPEAIAKGVSERSGFKAEVLRK